MFHSDILTWIAQLRTRVERNELAGHRLIDFGYGTTVPAERAVRTMLDTLRDLDGRREAATRGSFGASPASVDAPIAGIAGGTR